MTAEEMIETLTAAEDESMSKPAFLRKIVSFEWQVPLKAGESQPWGGFDLGAANLTTDSDGNKRLLLFTSYEAYQEFDPAETLMLEGMTGSDILSNELVGVSEVVLDGGSEHERAIKQNTFAEMRALAQAVGIEQVWHRLRVGYPDEPDDVSRAARYPGYYLAAVQTDNGFAGITVPHDDGRYFIPIFTHEDALALAMDDFRKSFAPAEIKTVKIGGREAFPALAKEVGQGLVFNFKGPGEPIAFTKEIIGIMLEELAKRDEGDVASSPSV